MNALDATVELLRWVEERPRTYDDAIDAWRSNCPRHPAWDDALSAGLVRVVRGVESRVILTERGRALLSERSAS